MIHLYQTILDKVGIGNMFLFYNIIFAILDIATSNDLARNSGEYMLMIFLCGIRIESHPLVVHVSIDELCGVLYR